MSTGIKQRQHNRNIKGILQSCLHGDGVHTASKTLTKRHLANRIFFEKQCKLARGTEAENGRACNYFFLMPLSRDHKLIISLSPENELSYLKIINLL